MTPDDRPSPAPPPATNPPPAATEAPIAARLDADGRLRDDTLCQQCGYNLRGLLLSGVCPECEAAVQESVRGDDLRYARRPWLLAVRRGVVARLWVILGGWGLMLFVGILGGFIPALAGAATVTSVLVALAAIATTWMITTPDPRETEAESSWSVRRLARIGALVSIPSALVEVVQPLAPVMVGPGGVQAGTYGALEFVLVGLWLVSGVAALLHHAVLLHAAHLARRAGRRSLARHCSIACWGQVISSGVLFVLVLPTIGAFMADWMPVGIGLAILMGLAGLAGLVFGLWALIVWFLIASMLKQVLAAQLRSSSPMSSQSGTS